MALKWTPQEVASLFEYAVEHGDRNMRIDWSTLPQILPGRSERQAICKFYRMIRDSRFNFERAIERKFRKNESEPQTDKQLNKLIKMLAAQ